MPAYQLPEHQGTAHGLAAVQLLQALDSLNQCSLSPILRHRNSRPLHQLTHQRQPASGMSLRLRLLLLPRLLLPSVDPFLLVSSGAGAAAALAVAAAASCPFALLKA